MNSFLLTLQGSKTLRHRFLVAILVAGFLLCLGVLLANILFRDIPFLNSPLECYTRNVSTPEIPSVYPSALFVRQVDHLDNEQGVSYTRYYETPDRPEVVAAFFDSITEYGCGDTEGYIQNCIGAAQPFGRYQVQIDRRYSDLTEFSILVEMGRCNSRLHEDNLP